MIRVLVVATSAIIRAGLHAVIATDPGLEAAVAGRATGGAALAADIAATRPDVVLVDLEWRRDEPAPDLPEIGLAPGDPAVVVLVDDPAGAWVVGALRSGIHAVIARDAPPEAIVATIRTAAAGLVTLPVEAMRALLPVATATRPATMAGPAPNLTAREIEVLQMLAEGLGNKLIARQLGISDHTVKFHVASIMTKLNAASRTEAVTLGARLGLILL